VGKMNAHHCCSPGQMILATIWKNPL